MVQPASARARADSAALHELSTSKSSEELVHELQNGNGATLGDSRAVGSVLPFRAVSTDGGQYSPQHACEQLFNDNKSCYSSELGCNHGVNIVARHSNTRYCTIDTVIFKVPTEGYSCPAAQAVLLTSWDDPDLAGLEAFDGVQNQQDFDAVSEAWCQQSQTLARTTVQMQGANMHHQDVLKPLRQQLQPIFSRPMPLAFLNTQHNHSACVRPKIPRSARYVIVKLLRPHVPGDNIDAEFVGLHGWVGQQCCPCRLPVPLVTS